MMCNELFSSLNRKPKASSAIGLLFLTLFCRNAAYGQSENATSPPVAVETAETETPSKEANIVYVPVETVCRSPEPDLGFMDRLACFFGFERRERLFSPPLGSSLREHVSLHRVRGRAARAVLYDYDFEPESSDLRQRGQEKVQTFADWVTESGVQVVVEHTPDSPELAIARKQTVVVQLLAVGISDAADFVMVGRPLVRARRAVEQGRPRPSANSTGTPQNPTLPQTPVAPRVPPVPQIPTLPGVPQAPAPGSQTPTLRPVSFQPQTNGQFVSAR